MHEFTLDLYSRFDKEDGGFCCQAEKEEKVEVGDGKRPLASEAGVVRRRQSLLRLSDRTESYVCVVCSFVVCFCPACPARRPDHSQPGQTPGQHSTSTKGGGAERISPVLQNKRKENTQKLENLSEE